jgi:hypothetical protein
LQGFGFGEGFLRLLFHAGFLQRHAEIGTKIRTVGSKFASVHIGGTRFFVSVQNKEGPGKVALLLSVRFARLA